MTSPPAYAYLDRTDQLPALLADLEIATEIAVDSEADSMHSYFEKVCLLQLTAGPRTYLVDPLAGLDLAPLLDLLARKPLILHGADYDLRMLRVGYGFRPGQPPFETMLAAQLIGSSRLGLTALVEGCCGVRLEKQQQRSDWARRPLTPAQLDYAAADTHYLPAVAAWCRSELTRLGRTAWHDESCAALVVATATDRPLDEEQAWRLKGFAGLAPQELAFARELWQWRDTLAREANRPPFMIMNESGLVALAQHLSRNLNLHDFRLPRHIVGARLEQLHQAARRVAALPATQYPALLARQAVVRDLEVEARIGKLRHAVTRLATALGLEPPVIASRSRLEAIARQLPRDRQALMAAGPLLGWQADLLLPAVLELAPIE
ncbi:MAG: HRDC domain-containing protein [bacterium]